MAGATSLPLPTVADLINEALAHLSVYAPGETLAAADQTSAMFTLQGIVDSYGAQPLMVFNRTVLGSFTLSGGKQSYTIGTANTNDWVTSFLPPTFDLVSMKMGTLDLGITIYTAEEWARIGLKSLQSNIVTACWPDYGAASHTLSFFPVPNATIPVTLYLDTPIQRFTAASNIVQFPAGYQELLTFELAIKCSSKFGAEVPAWLPAAYTEAKTSVKASNFEPIDLYCDDALVSSGSRAGGGSINFYLGR
jgi:hypothetical protein